MGQCIDCAQGHDVGEEGLAAGAYRCMGNGQVDPFFVSSGYFFDKQGVGDDDAVFIAVFFDYLKKYMSP